MKKIGIFYGSTTGATESIAEKIANKLSSHSVTISEISETTIEKINECEVILFGASTWGLGELQDDWEQFEGSISKINTDGKLFALFGTGDQSSYPDTFVDSLGIIANELKKSDAKIIGEWSKNGYEFDDSKALFDEKFIGLAIDEDNQSDLTDQRINDWSSLILEQI